jgi:CheY-like chemotaxis protein
VAVNILVADDSVTMRRILELTFQGEDARVTGVENGDAAVRKASELVPDVVFADLSLQGQGGMDGYALASAIKAAPGLERTAVVVMASQKHPYDEERGKAAGVDDHILKPFDTQHVIDRVKQVLSKPRNVPTGARAQQPTAAAVAGIPAAAAANRVATKTIAFGKPPGVPVAAPIAVGGGRPSNAGGGAPMAAPAFSPPIAKPAAAAVAVASATAVASGDLQHKLDALGLTQEQVSAVLALSREVVERVVWEIVPDLAETLIKEEIRRLTSS